MRYTNGGPKKLFVLVDQVSGDVHSFTSAALRKRYLSDILVGQEQFKKLTYVQEVR